MDEALPYSPFSSVVPFNSGTLHSPSPILSRTLTLTNSLVDIIPLPKIGLCSTPIFSTPEEHERGRLDLESLNYEAQDPHSTSGRWQKSLNNIKELLKPEGIAQLYVECSRL